MFTIKMYVKIVNNDLFDIHYLFWSFQSANKVIV